MKESALDSFYDMVKRHLGTTDFLNRCYYANKQYERVQIAQAYQIGKNDATDSEYIATDGISYYDNLYNDGLDFIDKIEEKECVELSSWKAADKVTLNGYVYVRSADLKFCNHQTNEQ